ncbi:high-potential iron-sulfur protein [Steroidobacter sp. S1-65]|uniref:High-potential iron-sulfur protein n=1 Tax=Steroidobacter gossypii TaxID=2805490 RepID=A0ABS1WV72_9GAMM|nr:high-potential iron-sulfur protein [Steroidobacter gossypii]MBM0104875.1 high-potential iron-sulfur protein [Steroidobacter gossypii]
MASCDRRRFITYGLRASALILASASARAACVDPDEMSGSVQSMRESLEYTDSAPDASQACRDCAYFKPVKTGDSCAPCEVLTSPVSASGHCVSWTKRS